jgi:sRNA-binding carbon storage regulator CsrA
MLRVKLIIDQRIRIGSDIVVSVTDIDATGVRLVSRGRVLGGPNDGAAFEKVLEMAVGASVNLTPQVALTLVKVRDGAARLDVFAPAHVLVQSE